MSRRKRCITLLLCAIVCSCGVQRRLRLDVQEARLVAGGESWELHYPKKSMPGQISELWRYTNLLGFAPNTQVSVYFERSGSLSVYTEGELVFDEKASFYQSSLGDEQLLSPSIRHYPEISSYYIHVEPPKTIPRSNVARGSGSWGGTLADETVEEVKENDRIVHHFHYEFAVDGISHVVDVAFRRKVETDHFLDIYIAAPATP